jgi:predicted  nucleic acid-binding Zn-ribbon protein
MEQKLDLLLSKFETMEDKLSGIETELKQASVRLGKLEEGQIRFEKKMDDNFQILNNQNLTLLSDLQMLDKKLDRQTATSRSSSAKLRELEMRIEDLEVSPPIK